MLRGLCRQYYEYNKRMHIPDGFLSPPVWASLDAVAIPAVAWSARRSQTTLGNASSGGLHAVPLLGVMGAFVFAAQMINFPAGPATSSHLLGGALLAITLGPAAASLVMTAVVILQALIFQDGGVIALGGNVCNMAIAGVLGGYLPYRLWGKGPARGVAIFAGGFLSVVAAAALALAELAISGVRIPVHLLWISSSVFLISGVVEGAITVAAVGAIDRLRAGRLRTHESPVSARPRTAAALGFGALILLIAGAVVVSAAPDGIERIAGAVGIHGKLPVWRAPMADYRIAALGAGWQAKISAGLAGLVIIFGACALAGKWIERRSA